jgi:SAM-dependent MidA family methyltransferase
MTLWLADEFAKNNGVMSFEKFMDLALHHQQYGYYSRSISGIGKRGDFTTTVEISPALPKAIANWAVRELKKTKTIHLIELGPGSGKLANAVIQSLPLIYRLRVKMHLVESSEPLRNQQKKLSGLKKAQWHIDIQSALESCVGKACIYSNEFFDAFPVRLFEKYENDWHEVMLEINSNGCIIEKLQRCLELPDSTIFDEKFANGQRVEVHESVQQWMNQLASSWCAGSMLTIDYGDEVSDLYHRKLGGGVRAYLAQVYLVGSEIYQNPGRQDITSDINFTDLIQWSSTFAKWNRIQSQHNFLVQKIEQKNLGDTYSANLDGAGSAFKVWECGL